MRLSRPDARRRRLSERHATASLHAQIEGAHSLGAQKAHRIIIFDKLLDANSLFLIGNSPAMYVVPDLDLDRDGPTVSETSAVALGAFNDAYFRYLGDID